MNSNFAIESLIKAVETAHNCVRPLSSRELDEQLNQVTYILRELLVCENVLASSDDARRLEGLVNYVLRPELIRSQKFCVNLANVREAQEA
jgi:flagellin-specific chaperone FliS